MTDEDSNANRLQLARQHQFILTGIAAVIVVAALLLTVRSDGHVAPKMMPSITVPESCPSKIWFGVECPGCGLTRSVISLAEGDLGASYQFNRAGWLVALAVLFQFPYRWYVLRQLNKTNDVSWSSPWWIDVLSKSLVAVLIGNWLLKVSGL